MLTLRDLMTPAPVTIGPTASLRDAVEVLTTVGVNALPVTDGDRVLAAEDGEAARAVTEHALAVHEHVLRHRIEARRLAAGSRVELTWKQEEHRRIVSVKSLVTTARSATT